MMEPQQIRYKEKSVIIHRDENGFGLRVGGENPVFVDCVHENGAAWKAGVRKYDRIIKVNGTLVRSYDHQRVVQMIQKCTPFVNLTLHSLETVVNSAFSVVPDGKNLHSISANHNNSSTNNNMQVHLLHDRPHHVANNLNWLLEIGDDLFQDNQQQQQQQQQHQHKQTGIQAQVSNDIITVNPNYQNIGVSKLIVSGPSRLVSSHSTASSSSAASRKLDNRHHARSQSNTRDNPYYYYKTAPEKAPDTNTCNSSTASLVSQDQSLSKASTSLSMVRSRSSSKMSIRSTSGKHKARNLRSRLVDDLRSLTITNSQTTPSSLSTSPSSSDLSDCDPQDSSRFDCLSTNNLNTSSGSNGGASQFSINHSPIVVRSKTTTRRLEIIRELIDTEKTHTDKLKQLNDLLYKPIKAEGLVPLDQLKMVFSCHKSLLKIHRQIYKKLAAAQLNISEHHKEPLIGKALLEIFEGDLGRRLEKAASTFCACQSTNTELLNRVTRKDTKAGEFLAQVANQQMLGRLGIKDLLASCFQRLTKYPLLLDNLLKATPTYSAISGVLGSPSSGMIHSKSLSEGSIAIPASLDMSNIETNQCIPFSDSKNDLEIDTKSSIDNNNDELSSANTSATLENNISTMNDEYDYERFCINRALQLSRQILIHVNEAVNRAIAQNKLKEIWKKTDKNPYLSQVAQEREKNSSLPVIDIDVEIQQLLHEGPLTLRLARRSFDVYVLLLTHYLVILTREGQDKYKLKYFTADGKSAAQFSPIFNIDEHLATRDTATDENGFYLLCKRKDDSRIYEFASQSPVERAKWKEKIHMAQLYNFPVVPDDDNTLTRYTELISLTTTSNTPDNVEHSPNASVTTTATSATTAISTTIASTPNMATTASTPVATIAATSTTIAAATSSSSSAAATTTTATTDHSIGPRMQSRVEVD